MNFTKHSILLIVLITLLCDCKKDVITSDNTPEYIISKEDHTSGYVYPTGGFYYEYSFSSYDDYIENVEEFLINLCNKSIIVTDAWYQCGSRMCVPPGSEIGMTVIVEPRFIIRLEKDNDNVVSNNFYKVQSPTTIVCGYYVTRYTKKNK